MGCKVLFAEDDIELATLIQTFLARHDFEVVLVTHGDEVAAAIASEQPDLLLLDILLPGKDGLTLCRELRPTFTHPIVMFTSLDSDLNQIMGLELGANDYILKTTPPTVLAARLNAQLRQHRSLPQSPVAPAAPVQQITLGSMHIDARSRDVTLDGQRVVLSTADFDLLWHLASHAGEVQERDTLLQLMHT